MRYKSHFYSVSACAAIIIMVGIWCGCGKKSSHDPTPVPIPAASSVNVIDSVAGIYSGVMNMTVTSSLHGAPPVTADTSYPFTDTLAKVGSDMLNTGKLYVNQSGYVLFDTTNVYTYSGYGTNDTLMIFPYQDSVYYVYHYSYGVDGGSTYNSYTYKRFSGRKVH